MVGLRRLVAQFAERVPMVRGRVDRKASTATGYAWIVWKKPPAQQTQLVWIPSCRKKLERDADYEADFLRRERLSKPSQLTVQVDLFAGGLDGRDVGPREAVG